MQLPESEPGARAIVVENRGHLPLEVADVKLANASFSIDRNAFGVEPGQADFFELYYAPPLAAGSSGLSILSNDFDQPSYPMGIVTAATGGIDVGDALDADFGFLDPSGTADLNGLEGHVVVLAYFALF